MKNIYESLKEKPFSLSEADIAWVKKTYADLDEEEKIGQLFCLIAYSSEEGYLDFLARKLKVGGIMCRVMPTEEVIKTVTLLQEKSKIPMLIAANLEAGGNGCSISGTRIGCEMAISASKDLDLGDALGEVSGKEGSVWIMTTSKIDYTDPKYQDPLEEVYAIRREISEQYGHDIHRLFEGLREWQREQEANGVKFNFAQLPIVRHQPVMA